MTRRPIMSDVAKLAGVSRTTVSLVLNGRNARISEATKRRIAEAVQELNFRPSIAAQQLRTRRSRLIAMIGDEIATGPFAGGLIAGTQAKATEREHAVVVMNSGLEGDLSVDFDVLEDRGIDGFIFATVMTRPVRLARRPGRGPVVLLNCFERSGALATVLPDDKTGCATAVALAADRGHSRIAWVGGERGSFPASERLLGYRAALRARGIAFDRTLVRYGNWQADSGYEESRKLLELPKPPTVVICGNDRMALGAYDAIKERGLSIPSDVSVVGYDDQEEIVRYMRPPLTTIRIPYFEMGSRAVAAVLDGGKPERILVTCSAVVRESLREPPTYG